MISPAKCRHRNTPINGPLPATYPASLAVPRRFLQRCGLVSVPDQTALLRCVPDPDRPPWAIRPTRTPPAGIAVIAEPQLSQLLATFGIEPIKARCRRRTVDPGRQVE